MTKPIIKIHDCSTDKVIEREMNAEELAQYEIDQANSAIEAEAKAQAITDKAALLAKLGITADEAKLLLG
ncbi:hypothetical protein UFOVP1648_24 [uncultured Caudovirales phage]|uniref:Uncharacterized protein n=1 Tax=uncultured Caudovirales phage TaxID=2100421 RepID=A0A6J5T301_9CAUD|nr:hypothetical protein UFOVP1648_24 [uncultured Caudovirales phage]